MLPFRFLLVFFVAIALVNTSGAGRNPDDAGSGRDAPNNSALALDLSSYGTYRGGFLFADTDWFRYADATEGPACIEATATASTRSPLELRVETEGATRSVLASFQNGHASAGFAVDAAATSYLSLEGGSGPADRGYGFELRRIGLPGAGAGDGGTAQDAGGRDAPMAVTSSCIAGTLGGAPMSATGSDGLTTLAANDILDVYSISLPTGSLTYSLSAASGAPLTLTLFDPAGEQVAVPIAPGQTIQAHITSPGTYQLVVQGDGAWSYLASWTIGPVPGVSCRPYCFV